MEEAVDESGPIRSPERANGATKAEERESGGSKSQLKRILHVLFSCIQQMACFALRIPSFQLISVKDQEILLRGSVLEMCFIRSGFRFDPQHESWPASDRTTFTATPSSDQADHPSQRSTCSTEQSASESSDENWYRLKRMKLGISRHSANTAQTNNHNNSASQSQVVQNQRNENNNVKGQANKRFILSASDIKPFIPADMFTKHMHFVHSIRDLDADQVTIVLLSIIVLLNPDRTGLQDTVTVSKEQEKYLILLRSYMNWRFGEVVSPILFGKFFLKLPDLKELSEVLSDCQLSLGEEEVRQVHQRLSSLSLSPSAASTDPSLSTNAFQHQQQQDATASTSSPGATCPWVFSVHAIPRTSEKSVSHVSQHEDDGSRSCSSSPSESIASTDDPQSPT